MSKRLIILCAIAFVLGLAINAHAAVQNVKVSGDLKVSAIGRDAFDLSSDLAEDDSNVIMSQTRVRVDADLTDNVSTTVRLLNERDWGREVQTATTVGGTTQTVDAQDDNEVDIDLAYVTLKEMLYCPLTVTIGRQEIQLGAGFVMGDVDTNRTSLVNYGAGYAAIANRDLSLRKAFDAVRATLDYDPLIIDLIYSKIDENQKSGGIDLNDKNDIDLYAMNAKYTLGDDWGTMLEAYLLYRNDKTSNIATGTNSKTDTIWCPGLRAVSAPIKDLILTAEIAWQTGAKVPVTVTTSPSRQREAMAYQLTGSYALPFEKLKKYSPEVGGSYSFYSGEKNPTDVGAGRGNYEAWDQLYENQGTGKIYNVLFDTTNVRALGMNMSMVPMQDVKLKLEYTDLWLQKEVNATDMLTLYGIDGQISTPVMNQGANHLGREIDLTATYDYTEDVQFGLTYGAFLPGNAFGKGATPVKYDQNASQLIGTCSVSF